MAANTEVTLHQAWALLRFAVVGPLLAAPPPRGALHAALRELAARTWQHPITGEPMQFGVSTIERWYYQARRAHADPVGALRKKVRKDSGQQPGMGEPLRQALQTQYAAHKSWSYQLHYDNLLALARKKPELGRPPSYATVRRFMKKAGLLKGPRVRGSKTAGELRAEQRLQEREVRSFEAEYVNGLWHLDFHHGSLKVLSQRGEWQTPILLGVLDDRSRLACHLQWYLAETAENLAHGLAQAFQKREVPRSLMTDNGPAMVAVEVCQGLERLGIMQQRTLAHSPYQNGKQESFWGQVEGRLMAMLEGCADLTLATLNEATQAWVELEYNRDPHTETNEPPISRYLAGPDLGRPSPDANALRLAFTREERRAQRRSDGTVSIEGKRFEVPSRYRHLEQLHVRYAAWDLTTVHLVDPPTQTVLCRLFPLDRTRNANGMRRVLEPGTASRLPAAPAAPGMAPLLEQLIAEYRAAGLPPAYLPKNNEAPVAPEDDL